MKLLIIEDEKKLALSLKKALESEDYAVDVIFDGLEGYELAAVEEYDAIILDIGLPSMDGVSVAKKLREEGIKTPILMLTARDTTGDKVTGLDSGADDYLVKPFDFNELLARIKSLIRRSYGKPEVMYKIDSLSLDPVGRIVLRAGQEIELSAKEYSLLEFLVSHEAKIVSRTQIIDHVWDGELDPFSNVVDVYIGYLRDKIDRDFPKEKPLIHTVRGLGYRVG